MPSPIPKRSSERRRRNVVVGQEKIEVAGVVEIPELPANTHAVARGWYEALQRSGQAQFFEPSDWAGAIYVAVAMTRTLNTRTRFNSTAFSAIWSAMNDLLTTEGARRKARLEVERAQSVPRAEPGVSAMDDYRQRLAK